MENWSHDVKSLVGFVLVSIVALLLSLFFRLGGAKPVSLSEGEEGPFLTVSKRHVGAYHKIVPVIEEVEAWVKKNGESCRLSYGEYLDDPDKVTEDRLQSNGGCVVEKIGREGGLPEGFHFQEIPRRLYVKAEFDGAPSIGPLKVYPRAKDYMREKGYKTVGGTIEMYEILPDQKVKTRYYFPVSKP